MIDLHTHTTASDGSLTPTELVRLAVGKKLEALAVTDHDTIDGITEALTAGTHHGLDVVPGIEISAEYSGGTLHILGYYIDIDNKQFCTKIAELQRARADRNPKIVKKLQALGMSIEMEDVVAEAGGGQIGRPHFAQALLKKGYVRSAREAFERFLAKGAAAYCEKFRFQPHDAIACITDAGGIAVLGHPSSLNCPDQVSLEAAVQAMVDMGIRGIEAFYSDHTAEQTRHYIALARKYHLLITGGSDFHGHAINGICLGTGRGNLNIPYECLAALKQALGRNA
ncbi:MAG: PHP domain-containing protein [Desulfobacterota bacterium]|nr:PHP domain-containing protein [Thermodesulfobacteriota bacterium]